MTKECIFFSPLCGIHCTASITTATIRVTPVNFFYIVQYFRPIWSIVICYKQVLKYRDQECQSNCSVTTVCMTTCIWTCTILFLCNIHFWVTNIYLMYLTHCILVDSSTVICWTSPFVIIGVSGYFVAFILFLMENSDSKQCRPRSDATWCGTWSGSALFASDPFTGFQVKMGYRL